MRKRPCRQKGRRLGAGLMTLGILLLLGAGGLVGYNLWDSNRAAAASLEISKQLTDRILSQTDAFLQPERPVEPGSVADEKPQVSLGVETMPVMDVDGYSYIGLLEIDSLELSLPVMDTWDEERLKISPCLYTGSYLTGDMVICAHNYLTHFSPIRWIELGTAVDFTAADGRVYHYTVTEVETLEATQIQEMIEDSGEEDGWDLTLFTCNTGGQTRCAVRCQETV